VRVQCYERASIDAPHREASADIVGQRGPRRRARGAAAMCAELWTRGVLGDGGAAPPLEACVYRGRIAVFPGSADTCVALAMRPVRGFRRGQAELVALIDRIAAQLQRCGDPDAIERRINAILRAERYLPLDMNLPKIPGRGCGPALPRRLALRIAVGTPLRETAFLPPAWSECTRLSGGIAAASPGTNCALGLNDIHVDCPDGADAQRLVRRVLDRHGLEDWRIVVVPPESLSQEFCYAISRVYPQRREVRLRSWVSEPG
jgi:hypothetical protein